MNNPQEKKMKKSVLVTMILTILAVAFVLGITGSINLSNKKSDENEPAPEGRLVGIFVVWESNSPAKAVSNGDQYLYATRKTEMDENGYDEVQYVFEQLHGVPFFQFQSSNGGNTFTSLMAQKICYIHSNYVDKDSTSHNGSLYLCSDRKYGVIDIYNVYQTEDERVYIDTSEIANSVFDSQEYSVSVSSSYSTPERTSESFSLTLQIKHIMRPENTTKVIEMNANNEIIRETEITLSERMEDFVLNRDTEYVITEQQTFSGNENETERKLYTRKDQMGEAFIADDDGICSLCFIQFVWQ